MPHRVMLDEYVDVLKNQLLKYGKVKVPPISNEQIKNIIAKLLLKGIKVKYENGFFVLESYDSNNINNDGNSNSQKVKVCVRLNREIIDALKQVYNEDTVSGALRKSVIEALERRGYNVGTEDGEPVDIDKLIGTVDRNEAGKENYNDKV